MSGPDRYPSVYARVPALVTSPTLLVEGLGRVLQVEGPSPDQLSSVVQTLRQFDAYYPAPPSSLPPGDPQPPSLFCAALARWRARLSSSSPPPASAPPFSFSQASPTRAASPPVATAPLPSTPRPRAILPRSGRPSVIVAVPSRLTASPRARASRTPSGPASSTGSPSTRRRPPGYRPDPASSSKGGSADFAAPVAGPSGSVADSAAAVPSSDVALPLPDGALVPATTRPRSQAMALSVAGRSFPRARQIARVPLAGYPPTIGFDYRAELIAFVQRNNFRLGWDNGSRLNRHLASDTGVFFLLWPALPPWRERDGTLSVSRALVTALTVWEVRRSSLIRPSLLIAFAVTVGARAPSLSSRPGPLGATLRRRSRQGSPPLPALLGGGDSWCRGDRAPFAVPHVRSRCPPTCR